MLNSKSFLLFQIIIGIFLSASAQTDQRAYDLKNVIPPSPNASSLGKYAEWPVNLYTGLPGISIPLYELKGRNLTLPITLSYHASGIKVGEVASSVGLGWSLSAGGVITRSVIGLPDDVVGAGYLSVRQQYSNPGDMSSAPISLAQDSTTAFEVASGGTDSDPDHFVFSALGISFNFYFAGDGTIVTQPYSNLRITKNASDDSWTVILENGTQLVFGGGTNFVEQTFNPRFASIAADITSYVSSWYLKSMTSPEGEVFNFTYTTSYVDQNTYYYEVDYEKSQDILRTAGFTVPNIKTGMKKAEVQHVSILNLSSIESNLAKIVFDTSGRTDCPGAAAINGMRVIVKKDSSCVRQFRFYYSYSSAVTSNVYPIPDMTSPTFRLKLDSLKEMSSDSSLSKVWSFQYNPLHLPARNSFAQDYWGYYNGQTANTTLLPYVLGFDPAVHPSGIRGADSTSMTAEMLTQITYPTKGYSQFNYEPNSYTANEEQFANVTQNPHLFLSYNQPNFQNTQTVTFTTTKPQYFTAQFTGVFSSAYLADFGSNTTLASAVLKDSSGNILETVGLKAGDNNNTVTVPSIGLMPGTYSFTISSISGAGDFSTSAYYVQLDASFTYQASAGFKIVNHPVGGVRVQSIFDFDGTGANNVVKKYYQYENSNVIAPVDSTVDFVNITTDEYFDCAQQLCSLPCVVVIVNWSARNSSTRFALGSTQGSTVGYTKVTVKYGQNAENGKTVDYFSQANDIGVNSAQVLPFPPITSYDWRRGLLTQEDHYTAGNALVNRIQHNYQFIPKNTIKAYKEAFKYNFLTCYSFTNVYDVLTRFYYNLLTEQVQDTLITAITYGQNGDSSVATTWNYYDDVLNMKPVRTVSFNSKGDSVLTYSRTVLEKGSINSSIPLTPTAAAAIDTMAARNIVGVPVETERYVKGNVAEKTLSNYKLQPDGLVTLDNVMEQIGSNPIEARVQINRYDSFGNVVQQQKVNDVSQNYIWDYQSNYPIAKCINADSSSIAYTSFEADGRGGWTTGVSSPISGGVTGGYYYPASSDISKSGLNSGKTYIISYWTTNTTAFTVAGTITGYPVMGRSVTLNSTTWHYFEHKVTGQTTVSFSGTGGIDELRLYPVNAQMATYTYSPLVGISSQCGVDNRISYYEYDGLGRLKDIKDQDGNVIKTIDYHYKGQ